MRKTFTAEFKARVGLEAVRGEKTVQEIGTLYAVHPNQVSDWKKQVLSGAAELFAKRERAKTDAAVAERREQALYAQVGKLSAQVEFLKKVSATVRERAGLVEPSHERLTVGEQCELLSISRSAYYYSHLTLKKNLRAWISVANFWRGMILRNCRLRFAQTCSIGFKSGEYGGKKIIRNPRPRTNRRSARGR
ncbi:hypothetical protein AGMMS49959_19070 [Planctomycetales bacterium]|nr:hypothetical protein AGMMS49959_19070 [Planctomycetales bacterium]